MLKGLVLLDSTYATRNYYPIVGGIDTYYYHPFGICLPLKYSLKKLNSITLKSVDIPLILNKIRTLIGTTSISFSFTYNSYINITVSK